MHCKQTAAYAALITFLMAGTALAHSELVSSVPEKNATVKTAPSEIALEFSEELNPKLSLIAVTDAGGEQVDKGDSHLVGDDEKHLSVDLKPLSSGTYEVTWTSVASDDGHKLTGAFKFTVAP